MLFYPQSTSVNYFQGKSITFQNMISNLPNAPISILIQLGQLYFGTDTKDVKMSAFPYVLIKFENKLQVFMFIHSITLDMCFRIQNQYISIELDCNFLIFYVLIYVFHQTITYICTLSKFIYIVSRIFSNLLVANYSYTYSSKY